MFEQLDIEERYANAEFRYVSIDIHKVNINLSNSSSMHSIDQDIEEHIHVHIDMSTLPCLIINIDTKETSVQV
jgi:hypothetical protein